MSGSRSRSRMRPEQSSRRSAFVLGGLIVGLVAWGISAALVPVDRSLLELQLAADRRAPTISGPVDGERLYATYCGACHGADGAGRGSIFPPLAGSDWVTAAATVPVGVVLRGSTGAIQVNGIHYDGVMPEFGSRLDDAEIAAIVTYVRGSWGNRAAAVDAEEVKRLRANPAATAPVPVAASVESARVAH